MVLNDLPKERVHVGEEVTREVGALKGRLNDFIVAEAEGEGLGCRRGPWGLWDVESGRECP